MDLKLTQIEEHPLNREIYVHQTSDQLKRSIEAHGLLQPVVVRTINGNGKYQLVSGHMRYNCCKELGHTTIRADIIKVDDEDECAVKLISSNTYRHKLPSELLSEYKHLQIHYEAIKQKKVLGGRVRDIIAKDINVSRGKLQGLIRIDREKP